MDLLIIATVIAIVILVTIQYFLMVRLTVKGLKPLLPTQFLWIFWFPMGLWVMVIISVVLKAVINWPKFKKKMKLLSGTRI
jgi:cell division protein FtsX